MNLWLGKEAHIYNQNYSGGKGRRIAVKHQPEQSYCKTLTERQIINKKTKFETQV
jgi:hypothetical protein